MIQRLLSVLTATNFAWLRAYKSRLNYSIDERIDRRVAWLCRTNRFCQFDTTHMLLYKHTHALLNTLTDRRFVVQMLSAMGHNISKHSNYTYYSSYSYYNTKGIAKRLTM